MLHIIAARQDEEISGVLCIWGGFLPAHSSFVYLFDVDLSDMFALYVVSFILIDLYLYNLLGFYLYSHLLCLSNRFIFI